MNMQPTPPDESILGQEVFTLSVKELAERIKRLCTSLELMVNAITSYAQATQYTQGPSTSVTGLEHRFKKLWKALELTISAITSYAEVADYSERQFDQLAEVAREGMQLVQVVTSGQEITPEWLVQRDVFVAEVDRLIDGHQQLAGKTEGGTTPP